MGVFDVAQHVVNQAAGVIIGDTAMNVSGLMNDIEARLMDMEIGSLFGLWFQSSLIGIIAWALSICIARCCIIRPVRRSATRIIWYRCFAWETHLKEKL